jgi:RNA polymerase sigma-70 factor (ECF subfamily)
MPENRQTDEEMFAAFQSGRPEALDSVRGWVAQVVTHPAWRFMDAESVVQDVLLKLLDIARSGGFRGASSFRTFAISVARHTCIDAYRRQRWRERGERRHAASAVPVSADDDPETRHQVQERRELLRYVFQKLPEECRRLWVWVYGQGLAARQVAELLGISESNVRVRTHRCLQKARDIARDALAQGA